jgi:hypothetical protein
MLSGTAKAGTAVAANANGVAPTADLKETKIQFSELGSGPMTLQGVQSSAHVTIGTRKDEVVVGAKLHLKFIYSPALLPDLSHLRISLNGEDLVVIPLSTWIHATSPTITI